MSDRGSNKHGRHRAAAHPVRWAPRGGCRPAPRRGGPRRLLPRWRTVLATALITVALAAGALLTGYLLVDIPEPKSAATTQRNVYLYADGSPLARTGEINRENIPLDRVPERVRLAVLAAEDRDFYGASAVDPKAMVRAGWNMLRGEGRQSGSTITQQYVKNYYLDQRQTLTRKVKEFFIAVKLDREVSKDEILQGYLNTSYFGRNAYGIQAAAQAYYGTDAERLDTAQGAYLATLLNAPGTYDVTASPRHRGRALARWNYVLDGMVSEGWLEPAERAAMAFPEPDDISPQPGLSGQRGYLVEAVRAHILAEGLVDEERLAAGGFRITTTIEPDRQRALATAVRDQLLRRLSADRPADAVLRAGAASVDTGSGRVVALYGGTDYTEQFQSNATRRDYQAASTFKPFVYAAALANGASTRHGDPIGPATGYDGASGREVLARDGGGTGWSPENEGRADYGEVTVRAAMDRSVNAVFAQMAQDVGPERVRDIAVRLGIPAAAPGLDTAHPSLALGSATPSVLDLAHAYATLAAHGERHPLSLVTAITLDGEPVPLPRPRSVPALDREVADAVTALLRSVVTDGTGRAAQAAGRPAAGKTGTAEEDKAAWFAGYTPELATVVALLGQDPHTGAQVPMYGALGRERISGGGVPARIWAQYTATALADAPVRDFELHTGPLDGDGGPREPEPALSRPPDEPQP
jgi:membrane peptidoglycan carboxypeptidase